MTQTLAIGLAVDREASNARHVKLTLKDYDSQT